MNVALSQYRGSEKHKNRPSRGPKGTLCPEWTHDTPQGGYGNDPFQHVWSKTEAHTLFGAATADPGGADRRYATKNGIAFEAKPTNDDSWHGFPIPWMNVPPSVVDGWLQQGLVTTKEIKKQNKSPPGSSIHWALESDT